MHNNVSCAAPHQLQASASEPQAPLLATAWHALTAAMLPSAVTADSIAMVRKHIVYLTARLGLFLLHRLTCALHVAAPALSWHSLSRLGLLRWCQLLYVL